MRYLFYLCLHHTVPRGYNRTKAWLTCWQQQLRRCWCVSVFVRKAALDHLFPLFTCRAWIARYWQITQKLIAALELLLKRLLAPVASSSLSHKAQVMNYKLSSFCRGQGRGLSTAACLSSFRLCTNTSVTGYNRVRVRALSWAPMAGGNLIMPHRKCAFHLLFLRVASGWLVIETSFRAENTSGINKKKKSPIFPVIAFVFVVVLKSRVRIRLSIELICVRASESLVVSGVSDRP